MFIKKTAREHENVQLSKKIPSWVSSYDPYWENKIDKRTRSIAENIKVLSRSNFHFFNLGYALRPEIIDPNGKSNCYTIVIGPRLHAWVNLHFILVPDHPKYKKLTFSVQNFTLLTRRSV